MEKKIENLELSILIQRAKTPIYLSEPILEGGREIYSTRFYHLQDLGVYNLQGGIQGFTITKRRSIWLILIS